MDRRKIIHQICVNVMATEDDVLASMTTQTSSSVTATFPAAAADVANIQTQVNAMKSSLNTWYLAWRAGERPLPPEQSFYGVFTDSSAYQSNLDQVQPMTRMVRNDFTGLCMLAMAYEEMYSIALALQTDSPGLMTIALDGLKDLVPLIKSLSETMCSVTIRDLHNQDNTIPLSDAATAIAATDTAWGW